MRTNSLPDHSLHEEPVPEVLYQKDQKTQYTTSSMDASRIPGNKISTESHTGTTQTCTELEVHVVDSLKSLSAVEYKNIIQEEDKTMLQTLVSSTNCPSILSVCAANQLEHAPQLNEPSSQTLLTSTKHDITSGLGIVDGHVDLTPQLDEPPAKKHKSDKTKECGPSLRVDLPSQLCFLAVPSCVHSQKPYLGGKCRMLYIVIESVHYYIRSLTARPITCYTVSKYHSLPVLSLNQCSYHPVYVSCYVCMLLKYLQVNMIHSQISFHKFLTV